MSEEYYQIGPKVNDIDFYIGADIVHINSFINTSVTSSATKIVVASSSISIASSSTFAAVRIITASSEAEITTSSESEIQLILETVPSGILQVLTEVHISFGASVLASKITQGSATSGPSLSTSVSVIRQTKGDTSISITSGVEKVVRKITKGASQSNILTSTSFRSIMIVLVANQIAINSRTIVNPPIRFSPNYIDETSIRTLLILDGKPLTNHKRELNVSLSPIFIENTNWNNRKTRYYKRASSSGKKTFSINWSSLPNSIEYTVDNRHGRDYLFAIAEDPDVHELKIINQDENGTNPYTETTYTVFVKDYSESLARRYISEGVYLYSCNLTLEEV